MRLKRDEAVLFPAYFVIAKTKTEMRQMIARIGMSWLRLQKQRGAKGAVMVDIDDTIIDGHENVLNGFEYMRDLYKECNILFPIHIVTARPNEEHTNVLYMLSRKGFCIPPDRLHMLPTELYGKEDKYVIEFKWRTFLRICEMHGGCVARFGDRLWDVAHRNSLNSYLRHVKHKDSYIFYDPDLRGTMSCKLPGCRASKHDDDDQ